MVEAGRTQSAPFRLRGTQILVERSDAPTAATAQPSPQLSCVPEGATRCKLQAKYPGDPQTREALALPIMVGSQLRFTRDGALVYRQKAGQNLYEALVSGTGRRYTTDRLGYLQGRSDLAISDSLVALLPVLATDSYTLYWTSAVPMITGVIGTPIDRGGVQRLVASPEHPLLLFNLKVALEWDARADPDFLQQLLRDLARTSELLYDWTNGQAALGDVQVTPYYDTDAWENANIRVYASNRIRPNALRGGVVQTEQADPINQGATFKPGRIRIGAVWNRFGESVGKVGEDWPRTLGHELGHYALYLDEDYLGLENGLLTRVDSCPSPMNDPYRDADSEFHPQIGWLASCNTTLSQLTNHRSDWETITTFYPWLKAPNISYSEILSGPNRLPLQVTRVVTTAREDSLQLIDAPIIYLAGPGGSRLQDLTQAQAILYTDKSSRVIDLGRPTLDQVNARGAREGDTLCVYDQPQSRLGCSVLGRDRLELTLHPAEHWNPEILIRPQNAHNIEVEVRNITDALALQAVFYLPNGTAQTLPLSRVSASSYTASFNNLSVAATEGYVRVTNCLASCLDTDRREEIAEYSLGGSPGTPGSKKNAPVVSGDGQVVLYGGDFAKDQFYAIQSTAALPGLPGYVQPVGQAYRLVASKSVILTGIPISIAYLADEVPAGQEEYLNIYYLPDANPAAGWQLLPSKVNSYHNEISSQVRGEGLYAVFASIPVPLEAGWNIFPYPSTITREVRLALESILPSVIEIQAYEAGQPRNEWKSFYTAYPPDDPRNTLKELVPGRGYWIQVRQKTTLWVKGPLGTRPVVRRASAPD